MIYHYGYVERKRERERLRNVLNYFVVCDYIIIVIQYS